MSGGRLLVISGSAIGSMILTGVLAFLSSLMTFPAAANTAINPPSLPQASSQSAAIIDNPSLSAGGDQCQVSSQFPHEIYQWCDLITHFANQAGLSPDLVAAIIYQESGGNPEAYSKSGAVGLMQVMPRDGIARQFQCINGPCFSNRPTIDELRNPEFNIQYGTQMLRRLEDHTGDIRDALRSYGPMDVGYYYADKVLSIYQAHKQ